MGLVEQACRQVPGDAGGILGAALRISRLVQELVGRKRRLANELGCHSQLQQLRLDLAMEVGDVVEHSLKRVINDTRQQREVGASLLAPESSPLTSSSFRR